MSVKAAALLLFLLAGPAAGQRPDSAPPPAAARTPGYVFLHPEIDYGSFALRSPADILVNRGLSVLVYDGAEHRLFHIAWGQGWDGVRDALAHPRAAVRRAGGLRRVAAEQLLPDAGQVWAWAWAPNYGLHLIGGGIAYRYMEEWFQERGLPAPRLAAGLVLVASALANEMAEMPQGPPGDAATLADLLVFDPAGIVLFSFDAPARFFANTLEAADWSPMPSIAPSGMRMLNLSQITSYKVPLPLLRRLRLLILLGESATTGLRLELPAGYHFAGAVGFETIQRSVDPATGLESVQPAWSGGLYIDRNNSLLVSAGLSRRDDRGLQVNVFPGVLPGVLRPAGVWASRSRAGEWSMGVAFRRTLGIGLGTSFAR